MKIKGLPFNFFAFVVCCLLFVIVPSCEIGLGAAVDTEAPVVNITYPPDAAVVMEGFYLAGTASDDVSVSSVVVKFKNVATDAVYSFDDVELTKIPSGDGKNNFQWKVLVNEKVNSGYERYNGYEMPDGQYAAIVYVVDSSGRKSGSTSRAFDIDNTAPVFVLNSPGITDITKPTEYGSTFKITGTIADDHTVKSVIVKVFDENGNLIKMTDDEAALKDFYTVSNVETSGGTSITVARSTDIINGVKNPPAKRYFELYNESGTSTQKYYSTIEVSDNAVVYKTPFGTPSEPSSGNKTSKVYLYDNVYKEFMGANGYRLDSGQLKKLVNGLFPSNATDRHLVSSVSKFGSGTPEDIGLVRSKFLTTATDTGLFRVAFSLNPNANPNYTVTGYTHSTSWSEATGGSTLNLAVSAGRDGNNIEPQTIRIYVFGPYSAAQVAAPAWDSTLNNIYENPKEYFETHTAEAVEKFSNETYSSSSLATYNMSFVLSASIMSDTYYIIAATGQDVNGLELENSGKIFGFVGARSYITPILTVTYPETNANLNTSLNLKDISGTATIASGGQITDFEYDVWVTDAKTNATIGTTLSGTLADSFMSYNTSTKEWKLDITQHPSYAGVAALENSEKEYKYKIRIKAVSSNGMGSEKMFDVFVDSKKPVINTKEITSPSVALTYTSPQETWYNTRQLSLKLDVADSLSGILYVYVSNDNSNWSPLAKNPDGKWVGSVTASADGANTIYFKACDIVGNIITEQILVNIDTTAPKKVVLINVDGETSVTSKLVNKKTAVTVQLDVADKVGTEPDTGIKSVKLIKIGNTDAVAAGNTSAVGNKAGTWTINITPDKLTTGSALFAVTDNAGNTAEVSLFSFEVDETLPTVNINTPNDYTGTGTAGLINKKITMSGTAFDNNKLKSLSFYVTDNSTVGTAAVTDSTLAAWGSPFETITNPNALTSWSKEFDSEKFPNNSPPPAFIPDESEIYIIIKAEDAAGNTGYSAVKKLKVNQDSDRPIITMGEIKNNGSNDSTITTVMYTTSITGTVSDDDGIVEMKISKDNKTSLAAWRAYSQPPNTLEYTPDSTSTQFKYTPEDSDDGEKTVYIYVKDKVGGEFWTSGSSNVKIKYNGSAIYADNTTVIKYRTDKTPPSIDKISASAKETNSDALVDVQNAINGTGGYSKYTQMEDTTIVGGIKKRYLAIEVEVKDRNGIKSVSGKFGTDVTFIKRTNERYYCTIDVANKTSGNIVITVTDNSGLIATMNKVITVDNAGPSISVLYPLQTSLVTGDVEIRGTASDSYSPVTSVKYLVMNNTYMNSGNSLKPGYDSNSALYTAINAATTQYNSGSTSAWEFIFDGQTHVVSGVNCKNVKLPSTSIELANFTNISNLNGIYTLPVYFMAEDELGNYTVYRNFNLKYNPYSDRPTTDIIYPTSTTGNPADLSGTIRVSGSAVDNVSVSAVYLQIALKNKDATIETMSAAPSNGNIWKKSVFESGGVLDGKYEIKTKAQLQTELSGADFDADPYFWGIKATNTASWYLTLNALRELQILAADIINPDPPVNPLHPTPNPPIYVVWVRAAAFDNNNKLGSWSDPVAISINPRAPSFSSTPMVEYYSDSSFNTKIGEENYREDMYVKGYCKLVTNTLHASDIQKVVYTDSKGGTGTIIHPGTNDWAEQISVSSESGYKLSIKMNVAAGSGAYSIDVTSMDKGAGLEGKIKYSFRYDNVAPTIDTLTQNGNAFTASASLNNSNNKFVVGGTVTDADSGFSRLMFYFYRKAPSSATEKRRLYDTQINHKTNAADSKVVIYGSTETLVSGITEKTYDSIPMYGVTVTGTRPAEDKFILTSANPHIRKGGMIYIGGAWYKVSDVSSANVVSIDGSIATSYTDAFFPYVQVVDNTQAERYSIFDTVQCIMTNDDGDNMPESVIKSASQWTWDATLHANFIPDGPITFVVFAMDSSGNISARSIDANIQTNPPRLSKVYLATDLTGDGKYEKSEFETYDILGKTGVYSDNYNLTTAAFETIIWNGQNSTTVANSRKAFTIKTKLAVLPEFVGGNNEIKLIYTRDASGVTSVVKKSGTQTSTGDSVGLITRSNPNVLALGTGFTQAPFELTNEQLTGKVSYTDADDGANKQMGFSFWDSTDELVPGTNSQHCFLKVKDFTLDVTDGIAPKSVIMPFYWKDSEDNSLYRYGSKDKDKIPHGHIELEADLPNTFTASGTEVKDRDPKVSGKISIRGYVYDETHLNSIWVNFGGGADIVSSGYLPTPSNYGTSGVASPYYQAALFTSSNWTKAGATMDIDGWEFKVFDHRSPKTDYPWAFADGSDTAAYLGQNGHKVYFQLDIDTAKLTGVVRHDVNAAVIAVDRKPVAGNNSGTAANTTLGDATFNKPIYRMDVVSYITKIETNRKIFSGLKDANIRSANGKYSVLVRDGNDITLTGFNFSPTLKARIVSKDNVKNATSSTGIGLTINRTSASSAEIINNSSFTKSGYLEIFSIYSGTKEIRAFNNINNDNAYGSASVQNSLKPTNEELKNMYYNREADLLFTKNTLLTDDRYLRLFDMKDTGLKNGYYPNMIMDGNDPVFGYVDLNGINPMSSMYGYISSCYHAQRTKFSGTSGTFSDIEYLTAAISTDQMAMVKDEAGKYIHATVYNYSNATMDIIYNDYAEDHKFDSYTAAWAGGTSYTGYNGVYSYEQKNNSIALDSIALGSNLIGRYQNIRMAVKGDSTTYNGASIYMAYYDDNTTNKDIIFRNFKIGKNSSWTNQLNSTTDSKNRPTTGTKGAWSNLPERNITGRVTVGSNASKNLDMGVTSSNIVVIVYYDMNAACLRLKYSSKALDGSEISPSGLSWNNSSVAFPPYVGIDVSMEIDKNGGIHIAAYDASTSDLAYIYMDSPSASSYKFVRVDQASSVGQWTRIKLKQSSTSIIPYIAYYNSTENGSRESIKLTYFNDDTKNIATTDEKDIQGVDGSGYTTGLWEYLTVPAITPPQGGDNRFKQVNLDFDTNGTPVVGYLGTNLEFGKWLSE